MLSRSSLFRPWVLTMLKSASGDPIVLSLMVQAAIPARTTRRRPFAALVFHILDRLLHSDSLGLGEESASRVMALAYCVALPGLLYALYLFPAYHSPLGKPPFWTQARDHFFYTIYGFTIMGLATVLEWDALFPDLIDTLILSSLPVAHSRFLLARAVALTAFFAAILLGTSILGIVFLPLISELPGSALRQLVAHAAAVLMAGLCASTMLVALQGVIITALGQRAARRLFPLIQAACVILLIAALLLFPLLGHFLQSMLQARSPVKWWFPPFWFLGLYELLLHGRTTPTLFIALARLGVVVTAAGSALAMITFPLAYARRVRQTLEGAGSATASGNLNLFSRTLSAALQLTPRSRGIHYWIAQTSLRAEAARLVLAVFGGFATATIAWAVLSSRLDPHARVAVLPASAIRIAIPMTAFWTVAGLRAAMRVPVAQSASWAFRIIHGRAKPAHVLAVQAWVAIFTGLVTIGVAFAIGLAARPVVSGTLDIAALCLLVAASSLILTGVFFLNDRAVPFTQAPHHSVNELSYAVLTYCVCFPLFCYAAAACEPWVAATLPHLVLAAFVVAGAYTVLCFFRNRLLRHDLTLLDMEGDEALLPGEIGLRT